MATICCGLILNAFQMYVLGVVFQMPELTLVGIASSLLALFMSLVRLAKLERP